MTKLMRLGRAVSGMRRRAVQRQLAVWIVFGFAIFANQPVQAQSIKVLHSFAGTGGVGTFPYAALVRDTAGNFYGTTSSGGGYGGGTVFKLDAAGKVTVLHKFPPPDGGPDGSNPLAGLVRDNAGNLYGTTSLGGGARGCNLEGCGTVFKVDASGKETVLHAFSGSPDGSAPLAGLFRDKVGNLYGTTAAGGVAGWGTVYKLDARGRATVLYNFSGGSDGGYPVAGLVRDSAGNFYGTTEMRGAYNAGTVFKLDPSGKETVLYSFTGSSDGGSPYAGVVRDPSGNLYGTTYSGGASSYYGTVFKLDTGGKQTVLYSFTGSTDGGNPEAGLILDASENLYGTTLNGGSGHGVVFKLDTTGKETVLYSFTGYSDGGSPFASLVGDASGNLYGTTAFGGTNLDCAYKNGAGCGVVFKVDTTGKETALYSFDGGSDGTSPYASLVRDAKGNLYGTTPFGGSAYSSNGTVFRLDTTGREKVLHSFTGATTDGAGPVAALVRDPSGNLYGTTLGGGIDGNGYCQQDGNGCGTVFKIDSRGKETVLYYFCSVSACADGGNPYGGLVRDAGGNLYGTTYSGGLYLQGTVFKLDSSGKETVLHNFTGYSDGAQPTAGLIWDNAGNLYGTTYSGGGTECGGSGCGTVFKMSSTGKEKVLHSFTDADGPPYAGLLRDKLGNLYGTTVSYISAGTVFTLNTSGKLTTLHVFSGSDGQSPMGNLVRDEAGNLYGTARFGGSGCGTVFKLETAGTFAVLHYFASGTKDGCWPDAGLILDQKGDFYGTTRLGGADNQGVVFMFSTAP